MQTKSNTGLIIGVISTVIFAALASRSLSLLVQDFLDMHEYIIYDFLCLLGYLALAGGALAIGIAKPGRPLGMIAFAGACVMTLAQLVYFLIGCSYGRYLVLSEFLYNAHFNIFCILPTLLKFLAFATFALILALGSLKAFSERKEAFRHIWIATPALMLLAALAQQILFAIFGYNWYGGYSIFAASNFATLLFQIAGMCLLGILVLNPKLFAKVFPEASETAGEGPCHAKQDYREMAQEETSGEDRSEDHASSEDTSEDYASGGQTRYYYGTSRRNNEGYFDILPHILLLLFTFGIWRLIWVYKITEFLNRTPGEEKRSGTCQLLLYMFVPFYDYYWIYKSCQRIDKLGAIHGLQGEITLMCVLFQIFISILAPVFMQDKINNIVSKQN